MGQVIYVTGYVTLDASGESSSGGFEWRTGRAELDEIHARWLVEGDCDVSPVRRVEIPDPQMELVKANDEVGRTFNDNVTRWLDERPELWEPKYGERV